jgi:hypothetical protein
MTRGEEHNIERAVGRIEAHQESMAESIKTLTDAVMSMKDTSDEWRHEVKARLESIEARDVSGAFMALQQSIRDGKQQAKGIMIGIGVAGGAAGATIASGFKWLWAAILGA